jgi:hypothetical protein
VEVLDVRGHVVWGVLEEGGVRVCCDCCRGIVRWYDVVSCESKAEDGVEDVVVGEVAGQGRIDVTDLVERLHAPCVEKFGCFVGEARGVDASEVVEFY